jgi:hypothetical protein
MSVRGHWLIECSDIPYQWLPLDLPSPGLTPAEDYILRAMRGRTGTM